MTEHPPRVRSIIKRVLMPVLNEGNYKYFQSLAMAWDIRQGHWREPELDLVPLALRDGEAALDVGACFGLYSYNMSKAVGRRGTVIAFEPVPSTFATLSLVAKLLRFKNVTLINKGASDQNEQITFSLPVSEGVFATALAHIDRRDDERPGKAEQIRFDATRRIECSVARLDDVVDADLDVAFVKCDVEGAELLALKGARRLIERHHPSIVLEINPWFLKGFGTDVGELLQFMQSLGYSAYSYDEDKRRLDLQSLESIGQDNYLFLHPQRKDRFSSLLAS